jgi:hypothetical protein
LIPALLLALISASLAARDGVQVSGDGNHVEIDSAHWAGAGSALAWRQGQPVPDDPIVRLMTGGPGARVEGADLACVIASREGRHRGRPFLQITLARACLDGRTLRLNIAGAPLWRTGKAADIDEVEKQWLSVTFANYSADLDPGPDAVKATAPGPAAPAFTGPRLRIEISAATGAGIYRINKSQMNAAGFNPASINPADFKLTRGGAEIPITVSGTFAAAGDFIEFYGAPFTGENRPGEWENGDYTDAEVYFLTLESGARLRLSPLIGNPVNGYPVAGNFRDTARLQRDNRFSGHSAAAAEPHFFDSTPILLCGPGSGSVGVTLAVPSPAPAAAQGPAIDVRVREWGYFYPETALHTVAFRLNGADQSRAPAISDAQPPVNRIASGGYYQWDNTPFPWTLPKTLSLQFAPAQLLTGNNTLTFRLTSTLGQCDEQLLKWIELDYNRLFVASANRLAFTLPDQSSRVQISGLSGGTTAANLLLYEITAPDSPRPVTGFTVGGTTLTVEIAQNPVPGGMRRFLLVPVSGVAPPALIAALAPAPDPGLLNPASGAKYLIIYHPDLTAGVATSLCPDTGTTITPWNCFLARKQAQFGAANVRTIPIQDVYNEFSYGRFDPEALHSLFQQALSAWPAPSPLYALLVGDGTADTKDNLNRVAAEPAYKNWVPTRNVDYPNDSYTGYWATDAGLAETDASGLPELAVGRLSVRTPAELNAVLTKHANYNGVAAYQSWMGRSLCATDKIDGGFDAFHQVCDDYASNMPSPQATTKLYYAMAPYNGSNGNDASAAFAPALRACMNGGSCPGNNGTPTVSGGYGLINYVGHGDQFDWSEHTFFSEIVNSRNNTVTNACHTSPSSSTTDIDLLCQGPPQTSYLMIFNCLSGAFMMPTAQFGYGTDTLAELAFKKSNGGPVGGIAPTSVGYPVNDDMQLTAFRAALNGATKIRDWGVLTQAIRAAPTSSATATFSSIFFGDPGQALKIPAPAPPVWDVVAPVTPGNMQVTLKFTAGAQAAKTRIYRAAQPPSSPVIGAFVKVTDVTTAAGAPVTYIDSGLTNTTTYYYRLATLESNNFEGTWTTTEAPGCPLPGSSAECATPTNPNPPAAPTGMAAADPGVGDGLDFSFTGVADSDLKNYTVYWGAAPGARTYSRDNGTLTSGRISGLAVNQIYYISASATNTSLHESPPSAEASAIPRQANGGIRPAAALTGLRLVKSGAADIRLNWTPVTTDIFGDATTLLGQRAYRADLRGPGGYNFNVFANPWPRAGFLDAWATAPTLTASTATWLDSGANGGGVPYSLAYLVIESNGQGDGAAGADLPRGILDFMLKKSSTAGWLAGYFSPVAADAGGFPLPAPPIYRVYRYGTAPCAAIVFDRSPTHACSLALLSGATQACDSGARYCRNTDLGDLNSYFYYLLVEDGHGSSSSY